ncbi:MAG: M67 family metallopeptidase [Magnetococcales bacterium]|nr:M67 family metallopeptidase [Magnetococcales bacterium]
MWILPRILVNKILSHAQRAVPRECVGVLSGQGRRASAWHPLTNIATDENRFLADPGEQIRLFAGLREAGSEVVAIYHSHPRGPATMSATDLEQAWHPEALTLIVSLDTAGRMEMNGYLLRDGRVEAQELTIED